MLKTNVERCLFYLTLQTLVCRLVDCKVHKL